MLKKGRAEGSNGTRQSKIRLLRMANEQINQEKSKKKDASISWIFKPRRMIYLPPTMRKVLGIKPIHHLEMGSRFRLPIGLSQTK